MASEIQESTWTFDAVDLRPVQRWLEGPERRTGAQAVEVVASRAITTQVDLYFETDDCALPAGGLRASHSSYRAVAGKRRPR